MGGVWGRGCRERERELSWAGGTSTNSLWPLTEKKASSKTSRGPEKPITSNGWAPSRQKSTPWMAVDMMSSETPIRSCVFSPRVAGARLGTGGGLGGRTLPSPPLPEPLLTQQPPEGDGGRQGRKVDEDDGGQALGVQRVPEVAQVVGVAAPHVSDQPPKRPARPPQGIVFHCTGHLYHLQERCSPVPASGCPPTSPPS